MRPVNSVSIGSISAPASAFSHFWPLKAPKCLKWARSRSLLLPLMSYTQRVSIGQHARNQEEISESRKFPDWEQTVTHLFSEGKLMLRVLRFTFAAAETSVAFQFGTQRLGTKTKKGKVRRGTKLSRRPPPVPALLADLGSSMLMISPHRPSEREPDRKKGPRSEHAALRRTTEVVFSLTRYDLTESARILD